MCGCCVSSVLFFLILLRVLFSFSSRSYVIDRQTQGRQIGWMCWQMEWNMMHVRFTVAEMMMMMVTSEWKIRARITVAMQLKRHALLTIAMHSMAKGNPQTPEYIL